MSYFHIIYFKSKSKNYKYVHLSCKEPISNFILSINCLMMQGELAWWSYLQEYTCRWSSSKDNKNGSSGDLMCFFFFIWIHIHLYPKSCSYVKLILSIYHRHTNSTLLSAIFSFPLVVYLVQNGLWFLY